MTDRVRALLITPDCGFLAIKRLRPGQAPYSLPPSAWALQSRLELAALPGAVPCARLHARQLLTEMIETGEQTRAPTGGSWGAVPSAGRDSTCVRATLVD